MSSYSCTPLHFGPGRGRGDAKNASKVISRLQKIRLSFFGPDRGGVFLGGWGVVAINTSKVIFRLQKSTSLFGPDRGGGGAINASKVISRLQIIRISLFGPGRFFGGYKYKQRNF